MGWAKNVLKTVKGYGGVIIGLFLIIGICYGLNYFGIFDDTLDGLNKYSNLILVAITAIYAFLTMRMVVEMRQAREAEYSPYLVWDLKPFATKSALLQVRNVGRGSALNVVANVTLKSSNTTKSSVWATPALTSNASQRFVFLDKGIPNLEDFAKDYESFIIEFSWENAFGEKWQDIQTINFRDFLDNLLDAAIVIEPDELELIRKEIKNVVKAIRKDTK